MQIILPLSVRVQFGAQFSATKKGKLLFLTLNEPKGLEVSHTTNFKFTHVKLSTAQRCFFPSNKEKGGSVRRSSYRPTVPSPRPQKTARDSLEQTTFYHHFLLLHHL